MVAKTAKMEQKQNDEEIHFNCRLIMQYNAMQFFESAKQFPNFFPWNSRRTAFSLASLSVCVSSSYIIHTK